MRQLVWSYPRHWRRRYGAKFAALLEQQLLTHCRAWRLYL
jgi:hypothetical protein